MQAAPPQPGAPGDDAHDPLNRAYAAIVDEARSRIAAGDDPDPEELEARIRAARRLDASGDGARAEEIDRAEQRALQQLAQVLAVHRARALIARQAEPPPASSPAPLRRAVLRSQPTISGNLEVRRLGDGETAALSWDGAPAVTGWEVRFSERPDARADYVVRETLALPAEVTTVELPLGDRLLRVHVLGRGRDGRLVRRALISALTRETWNERWERRASAS